MGDARGLGALVGLKIVCCGGLLLVVSGAVAATQLAWGAGLLLGAAGVALFVRHRRLCMRRGGCEVGAAHTVSSQAPATAPARPMGGSARP